MLLAERIAEYAAGLEFSQFDDATIHEVKRRILDSLACAAGAYHANAVTAARRVAGRVSAKPGASFFGGTQPTSPELAAFVNGNMFFCLLGDDVAVRLPEDERIDLLKNEGTSQFEPPHGRPMREYITVPSVWQEEPEKLEEWVIRSFCWVSEMPEKQPKPRKKRVTAAVI